MSSLVLFAAGEPFPGWVMPVVFMFVAVAVFIFVILNLFVRQYKRCPSNRVLVIYGKTGRGEAATCVHGGARLVVPLFEDHGWLSLEPMEIEVGLKGVSSKDNVRISLSSVFTVAIGTSPELMQNAAIRLLGLTSDEIRKQAERIIVGQLRQVIASANAEDIDHSHRFLESIQASLEPELAKIGVVVIGVDMADEPSYGEATSGGESTEAVERAVAASLLRKLLAAIDVSVPQFVTHLLDEGKLSAKDREEIRRLLDGSSSSSS